MNTQLLCLFTYKNELDTSLEFIMKNYILINPNIFILVNKLNDSEFYITYNVERGSTPIDSNWKTILVHRKKQSNTIYTINALNTIIKHKTGGQLDTTYQLDWDDYRNSILITSNQSYKKIPTKIHKNIIVSDLNINDF